MFHVSTPKNFTQIFIESLFNHASKLKYTRKIKIY